MLSLPKTNPPIATPLSHEKRAKHRVNCQFTSVEETLFNQNSLAESP